MRILLAPTRYLPLAGGVPVVTRALAMGLVARGHHVTIVTCAPTRDKPSVEIQDGIELHRMPFVFPWRIFWEQSAEGFLAFCRSGPTDLLRLTQLIREREIEVINIHAPNGSVFPYALGAHLVTRRHLVVTFHGNEFFRLATWHTPIRKALLRYSLRRARRVVTVSPHLLGDIERMCPAGMAKVVLIPNGIALAEFGPSCESDIPPSPFILAVGRLNRLKGHDVLLTAFRDVVAQDGNVRLLLVGDGPERARLHAVRLALGIQERVALVGELGQPQLRALLSTCEFLVLSSWSEGLPMVALEAMASGKAIVSSRVGGLPELLTQAQAGLLVPPGDPSSLAGAMLTLLRDREQRRAMGERARTFVQRHHDAERVVDRYVEIYRQVVGQSAAAGQA